MRSKTLRAGASRRLFLLSSTAFLTLSLVACSRSQTRGTADAAAPRVLPSRSAAASPKASPPPSSPSEHTGVLDEAGFKKLHELSKEKTPPLRGAPVTVGKSQGYLSLPPNAKPPFPAVVVIHEWWGLNDHIRHWADRLAADGYAALAVDLYQGKVATSPDDAMKHMKAVNADQARATLLAAHELLKKDARVQATRRGSVGWCFGGKWSLELALAAPDLDAAVVYYGHVTTDAERLKALKAPLLGIFGNQDEGIPPATVDRFDGALKQVGATRTILRFDAKHAFANPSSARYDHASAAAAYKQVRAFLGKHLKSE